MTPDEVRQNFTSHMLAPVLDFATDWIAKGIPLYFHDPLAAVTLFRDEIVDFRRGRVTVELTSPTLLGASIWHEDPKGNIDVGLGGDATGFFEEFLSVFE